MILDSLNNSYFRAFIILIVLIISLRLLLYVLEKILLKITSKTKSDIDDKIILKLSGPLTFLAFLISLRISLNEIVLTEDVQIFVHNLLYTLLILNITYIIYGIVDILLSRGLKKLTERTESDIDDSLAGVVHGAVKFALIILALIYVLNLWGIEIGPLLAGLGIAGLAVALALQTTLSNIFSGVSLILDRTFKIGDIIKLSSGEMGIVNKIGLRTTRITTFDNEMIIVPNSKMADSIIQNFHQPDKRIRVSIEFGVEYGVDPEYIKKITIEEIDKIKIIDRNETINVMFTHMADSALTFKVMFWVDDISKKWPAHQEGITRIYRRLYKEGIGIPFPQRTVWLREEGKVKSLNPSDKKFNLTNKKYLSDFGREYKEKEVQKPKKTKKEDVILTTGKKLGSKLKDNLKNISFKIKKKKLIKKFDEAIDE